MSDISLCPLVEVSFAIKRVNDLTYHVLEALKCLYLCLSIHLVGSELLLNNINDFELSIDENETMDLFVRIMIIGAICGKTGVSN